MVKYCETVWNKKQEKINQGKEGKIRNENK
jgi:hypothetical protein